MSGAKVQISAEDSVNSFIDFGGAFKVSKGSDGVFGMSINSPSDDAIKVNNNPVWHKGNIVVAQTQPASGKKSIWLQPSSTQEVNYRHVIASKSASSYSNGNSRTYAASALTTDTMTGAGTYTVKVKGVISHYGDPTYTISGLTIVLTKGGKSITLTKGSGHTFYGWKSLEFELPGTTIETAFASTTGDISCVITPTGTIAYSASNFLAHAKDSLIEVSITGEGSGTAQVCTVYYVP